MKGCVFSSPFIPKLTPSGSWLKEPLISEKETRGLLLYDLFLHGLCLDQMFLNITCPATGGRNGKSQAVASYSTVSSGLCGGSHMQFARNYPLKCSYEPISHGNTVLTRPWCGAVHTLSPESAQRPSLTQPTLCQDHRWAHNSQERDLMSGC